MLLEVIHKVKPKNSNFYDTITKLYASHRRKQDLLRLEIFHEALHLLKFSLQTHLVLAQSFQLLLEAVDVRFEHAVNVYTRTTTLLQHSPLCFQNLFLLFQILDLHSAQRQRAEASLREFGNG